jgi:hypothetical protein
MYMQHAPLKNQLSLSPSQIADLRLAASKLTGPKRRAFEAEMTVKYCGGNPLMVEAIFGWGRQTVALGLAERRTGIMCLGAQAAFSGRKRWEERHPPAAQALRQLAEAHAQQDPTFRTSLTYTRLTAQAALKVLNEQGYSEEQLPKLGQDMRYASAEIKGSCFELKFCLSDVMKSSKVAKLNGRKVWSISSK